MGSNAYVVGDIDAKNGAMTIDGDLRIAMGSMNNGAVVLGQTLPGVVLVPTPCDCAEPIDVAGIAAGYSKDNDDATLPIEPTALENVGSPTTLELPCGVYYFTSIATNQQLTFKLLGRTVIAIAGDLQTGGNFAVEPTPGAELDLFIGGDVTLNNISVIGDITRPAATRIYVGGAFLATNKLTLGGNLYQPNAIFQGNNIGEVWGSRFVGGLMINNKFTVHYDSSILDLDGCEEPGGGCTDCHDCVNPTPSCKDGDCAPCEVDSDCCPPLVCDGGECKAIIPG